MLETFHTKGLVEIGIDEVGLGAFAGPIIIATCIMPADFNHPLIKDSKKLSEKQRLEVYEVIKDVALDISIGVVNVSEINVKGSNVNKLVMKAIHNTLDNVPMSFDHILMDGNKFNQYKNVKHTCIVKGDNKYTSIAAASIVAKTFRDNYMKRVAATCDPIYELDKNVGYGTKAHREAIRALGPLGIHRTKYISNYINTPNTLF